MRRFVLWAGFAALPVSLALLAATAERSALEAAGAAAVADPAAASVAVAVYAVAFALRAGVWSRVAPSLPYSHSLAAIHVSLLGNHVLPLRLGEVLRVTSVVKRSGLATATAAASTLMLRAADVLAVAALAVALGPRLVADLVGPWAWPVVAAAGALWAAGVRWLRHLRVARGIDMRIAPVSVAAVSLIAWVLESAVMWQAARWAGLEISVPEAVLVTAVTIAAQTLAIAPGGVGTYEAAATAAFVALGSDAAAGVAAAIVAHALKTAYALVAGGVFLFVPSPSVWGRLRLDRTVRPRVPNSVPADAPVMLFFPAHDEAAMVARVVERTPGTVMGRDVVCLVVDDGSTDATAELARRAGADVISLPSNQGLGAAVRAGLRHAVARDVAAVAFCDADGEYAPEELERLVSPILQGRADYVVGSRFAGDIRRMLPHRRAGNLILTKVLSVVARRKISDGQSGYRAFSPAAAADAEVVHDFNYAQVLTLDLLAKGYRYAEVPISYSFRESGRSFIKLGRYLRHVIPAVHRELNHDAVP